MTHNPVSSPRDREENAHKAEDELDLAALFRAIWKTRKLVLACVFMAALLLAGLLTFFRVAIPSLQTFQQAVGFVFEGVQKGRYPNDTKFSLSDLVAPAVLLRVHQKNQLSKHGISLKVFTNAVSVISYATTINQTIARYRNRFTNKKLTFIESRKLETEMAEELDQMTGRSGLVRLTLVKRIGIPDELGLKLVNDIAVEWARYSIDQLGVLKLPETLERTGLVDVEFLKTLDYPIAADLLSRSSLDLVSRIDRLKSFGASHTLIDKKSGYSVSSLQRDVSRYMNYELNNLVGPISGESYLKFPNITMRAFQRRIDLLKLDKKTIMLKVEAITSGLRNYQRVDRVPVAAKGSSATKSASATNSTSPQISEGFIERILALSDRKNEQEFRQNLIVKQIKLREEAIAVSLEQDRLQRTITVLSQNLKKKLASSSGKEIKKRNLIEQMVPLAAKTLNRYWAITGQLLEQLNTKNYSYSGQLYVLQATPDAIKTYHSVLNFQTGTIFILLLVVTAIFAMFFGLIQQMLRRN